MDEAIKIILLSLLLTIVYSWEEFKHTLKILFSGLFRRSSPGTYYASHLDQMVSTIVMLCTLPFVLTYFLVSDQNLIAKFLTLAIALLVLSFVAAGSAVMLKRAKAASEAEGRQRTISLVYAMLGLFSPVFQSAAGHGTIQRSVLAKFAFYLSLPAVAGFIIKYFTNYASFEYEYLPNLDALLIVLVGSLMIRITVDFLEFAFRAYKLERLFSYYRIVLGIALAAIIVLGMV